MIKVSKQSLRVRFVNTILILKHCYSVSSYSTGIVSTGKCHIIS
jgi:hypothetical protein